MKVCGLGQTIVLPTDASLVRNIVLSKTFSLPRATGPARHLHRLLMGDDPTPSMFNIPTPTPYVKAIRRYYAESFTTVGMRQAFYKQMEVMEKGKLYLERTQGQDTIDLQDFFIRLMLDVVGKVELDLDLGGLDRSSPLCDLVIRCGHHMSSLGAVPFLELRTKLFPSSKLAQGINQDFKDLENIWVKIALEVHNRGVPDEEDVTIAANLRRVCMPGTKTPLPLNLLRGELALAIVGGFDTTSHQLSWIFALLATHPFVVEKLLDELKTQGLHGNNARELEYEDLSQLKYLTGVVKEGMRRLHTLASVSRRVANRDLVLDGYRVPKGTLLEIPSNSLMNSEIEWEDHLAFKPERWLEDKINIKEKYYFPFSLGERDCVGMKLAMQFMKVTIVYFITKFSFELEGDTIESLVETGVSGLVFEAKDGVNMKVAVRLGA